MRKWQKSQIQISISVFVQLLSDNESKSLLSNYFPTNSYVKYMALLAISSKFIRNGNWPDVYYSRKSIKKWPSKQIRHRQLDHIRFQTSNIPLERICIKMTPVKSTGIHFNVGGTQQSRTSQNCCVCVKPVYNWGIVMRATYVSVSWFLFLTPCVTLNQLCSSDLAVQSYSKFNSQLSFVLCAVIIVGSCPLHQLKVDPSADEDYPLISSFQSPQKE